MYACNQICVYLRACELEQHEHDVTPLEFISLFRNNFFLSGALQLNTNMLENSFQNSSNSRLSFQKQTKKNVLRTYLLESKSLIMFANM